MKLWNKCLLRAECFRQPGEELGSRALSLLSEQVQPSPALPWAQHPWEPPPLTLVVLPLHTFLGQCPNSTGFAYQFADAAPDPALGPILVVHHFLKRDD